MTNEVILSGTVVQVRFDKNKTRGWVVIAINNKYTFYPSIVFEGELAKKAENISLYRNICILARMDKFKNYKTGKWYPEIVAVNFEQNMFDSNVQNVNSVVAEGEVHSVYNVNDNVTLLTLKNECVFAGQTIKTYIDFQVYGENRKQLENLKPGDSVVAKGFIATKVKNKKTKNMIERHFTDIILRKIRKVA